MCKLSPVDGRPYTITDRDAVDDTPFDEVLQQYQVVDKLLRTMHVHKEAPENKTRQ